MAKITRKRIQFESDEARGAFAEELKPILHRTLDEYMEIDLAAFFDPSVRRWSPRRFALQAQMRGVMTMREQVPMMCPESAERVGNVLLGLVGGEVQTVTESELQVSAEAVEPLAVELSPGLAPPLAAEDLSRQSPGY